MLDNKVLACYLEVTSIIIAEEEVMIEERDIYINIEGMAGESDSIQHPGRPKVSSPAYATYHP